MSTKRRGCDEIGRLYPLLQWKVCVGARLVHGCILEHAAFASKGGKQIEVNSTKANEQSRDSCDQPAPLQWTGVGTPGPIGVHAMRLVEVGTRSEPEYAMSLSTLGTPAPDPQTTGKSAIPTHVQVRLVL